MMTRILYLEDEVFLGRIVKETLSSKGFEVIWVKDGAKLLDACKINKPDIFILDIMVPNIDGYTLGESIRKLYPNIPIIFLSAKNQTEDVLRGFKVGGNEYIKKPFSLEELIARINNLLQLFDQSQKASKTTFIPIGDYEFYPNQYLLKYEKEKISLSHRDNELLQLLTKYNNSKIDRRLILKEIWGDDSIYNSRNLDVYISKLRVIFNKDPRIQLKTLRGFGYYWGVDNK